MHRTASKVTILEKFDARLAEIAIQMDDEFLNDMTFFVFTVIGMLDVGTSGMHPVFLKASHFEKVDDYTEAINRESISTLSNESNFKDKSKKLATEKSAYGVVMISEKVCSKPVEAYPAYERRWYQQDITKS
jgi:hypothetical protein